MINTRKCAGCMDDFYNGKNNLGVNRCWHAANAKMVKRMLIPIWQPPPYTMPEQSVPNCYKAKGYATVDKKKSLDSKGYWLTR